MASAALLEPPSSADPAHTRAILDEAPSFLASQRSALTLPYPLDLLLNSESQEKWASYETVFLASIHSGDTGTAQQCLRALTERFGKLNERILALQGIYDEATASDDKQLSDVLKRYDEIIAESPTMFSVRKRRAALLKSRGKVPEAIGTLVEILDASPIDAEAWAELADLYVSQGVFDQACFCLEEVLLVTANAWNIHAKLGEVLYLSAGQMKGNEQIKVLSESMRRFCRSIELCDNYLRGFYGLKLVSSQCCTNVYSFMLTSFQVDNSAACMPFRQPLTTNQIELDFRPIAATQANYTEAPRACNRKIGRDSSP